MKDHPRLNLWLARLLIAGVIGWNLQCAIVFFLQPDLYAPGFELAGVPGAAAVRGMGILFVMWNIPYLVALWDPRKHRASLWEAFAMQVAGLAGESALKLMLPPGHALLAASILRFIVFDAAGLILLALALLLSKKHSADRPS